jgi:biotin carboxylase
MRRLRLGRRRRRGLCLTRSHHAGPAGEDRPRVLLISPHSSYRIAPYLHAAQRLGLDLLIASEGRHSLVSEVAEGVHVDLASPEAALQTVLQATRARPVTGVFGSDDATVELASRAAHALGLPHNPPDAARYTRRKDLARARLAAAGLPVPEHRCIELDRPLARQVEGVLYPCVVKPLAMSGSRGVIRADTRAELLAAIERLRPIVAELPVEEERRRVLIEAFIPGAEYALEGLLEGGELRVLALFDKPDPLEGPYFEETYYITPSRLAPALRARIAARVGQACAAYGLREGPVHAEVRLHGGEAWILEVAARTIGGQCARLLRFGTGLALEEIVLSWSIGRRLSLDEGEGGAGVLMIPIPRAGVLRRVEGVLAAQRVPYIEEVEISVREGYELAPLPEGSSYLGFIFARAPSAELAERALRAAHAHLEIVVAPLWRLGQAAT